MHNIVFVEYLEGFDELFEDQKCCFFWDDSIFAKHAFESASVAVLVDEVEVVGCLEHVDIFDDMLIFFDVGEYIDFVDGAFF